jgi:hypothetical protein
MNRTVRKDARQVIVHHFVAVAVLTLTCTVTVAIAQTSLQTDADSMRAKLVIISETGDRPADEELQPVHTVLIDREINAYLKLDGPTFLPDGLTDPEFDIGEHGRVTARGIVDLDVVRLSRQRDWLDPMAYLTGLLEFSATSVVTASDGTGVARFESATLGDISVPKNVVRELLRYYTTTPETPNGFDLDAPIELPANIQSVLFESGRATVIQ